MSFYPFGPLPTPPQNPIPGLPGLQAAIHCLEATCPTPAGWKPAVQAPAPAGWDAGAAAAGLERIRQRCEALLAESAPEVRSCLRRIVARTLEAVEADLALPPTVSCRWQAERQRLTPIPYRTQEEGRPCVQVAEPGAQGQAELDRLLRQALWRAVDALEAWALLGDEAYLPLLAEQCAQIGRVYERVQRRAGVYFAPFFLQGELVLLRHRGSAAVKRLLFA